MRVGAAGQGWEVPCLARPARKKRTSGVEVMGLASMPENIVREALRRGSVVGGRGGSGEEEAEAGGGWVEDLNGLLGFNKGFRGRYVDTDAYEEE